MGVIQFRARLQPRGPAAAVVLDDAQVAVAGEGEGAGAGRRLVREEIRCRPGSCWRPRPWPG